MPDGDSDNGIYVPHHYHAVADEADSCRNKKWLWRFLLWGNGKASQEDTMNQIKEYWMKLKEHASALHKKHAAEAAEWTRILLIVLLAVFAVVSLIYVFPSSFTYSDREWKLKEDSASYYDGLAMDQTITQSFRAEGDYLESVYLRFATFNASRQDGQITFMLTDENGGVLYTESVEASKLPDGLDYDFQIKKQVEKGKNYVCTVSAFSGEGLPPAVWVAKPAEKVDGLVFGGAQTDDVLICRFKYRHMDWIDYALILAGFVMSVVFIFYRIPFGKRAGRITGAVVSLLVMPYVSFCLVEYLFQNPFTIPIGTVFCNYVIYLAVYLLVYAATNRFSRTIIIANSILVVAGIANYYVLMYRGTPICPWDLYAVRTAADVASGYSFSMSMQLIAVVMLTIGVNILALSFKERIKIKWFRISFAAAALVYTIGLYQLFCASDFLKNEGFEVNLWEQNRGYVENGYILSFFMNVQYLQVEKPQGYTADRVEEILDDYDTTVTEQKVQKEPNIIMIMNEAFSELSVVGEYDTNTEYLSFWNGLRDNTVRGSLLVSVYGGGTCNSEYEVLTGNSMAFLANGSIAYQQYINGEDQTGGMARSLKDAGYTCYAMHPLGGGNWNRTNVYKAMGFDRFYDIEDFDGDLELVRDRFIGDLDTYKKIIDIYENKKDDKPLFLFDVTVQNHGGYESNAEFEEPVELLGTTSYPKVNEYLSLLKISDDAFSYLVRYFENVDEPTMIVMFGDHQPSVEEEFYEELKGKKLAEWSLEETQERYQVPFIIWTNYEIESQEIELLSANYLGGLVYEYAGLPMPKYYSFMEQMRKEIPAVNSLGYMDADGKWYSWQDDSSYSDVLQKYRYLHYNSALDKSHTSRALYGLKDAVESLNKK